MKLLSLLTAILTACTTEAFAQHLLPLPAAIVGGDGSALIDSTFSLRLTGPRNERSDAGVERFVQRLAVLTGMPLRVRSVEHHAPVALEVQWQSALSAVPKLSDDESYQLHIQQDSSVLQANSFTGILRGFETYVQLVELGAKGFFVPFVTIRDSPRFPWRGLLIDVCRHGMPPDVIKRNVDGMALVKMNVLHWRLSDARAFRVESKRFPKLHSTSSDGSFYTQDQIKDVVAYAAYRGIRVVPEFQLSALPPALDPTREETYKFLDDIVGEMAALFPDSHFHIGGDPITTLRAKEGRGTGDQFYSRLSSILKKHGKTMMRGDELSEIPKENVVQTSRHVMESIQRGSWGIFSSGFSLDQMQPASLYYAAEEIDSSLQRLTHEERSRILGGEACLSSEFVTAENIDSRIWPRTAAIAERLWSRFPTDNIEDLYRRLTVTSSRLELLAGVTHRRGYIQMLERLARTSSLEQLKYLADVVEPVSVDERRRLRDSTGTIPLNRLVDTALPESEEARVFARLVKELQQRTIELDGRTLLTDMLAKWKGVHSRLDQILLNNYLLDDIGSLSRDLSDVAVIALKLIEVFETDGKLSEGQVKLFGTVLERAQHGKAGVRLAIVPPIHEMFKVLTR